ncbi:MerR family transcriptional regulator [Anaerococcus sp.]|uniref:MerR family transcriptional regulator n=1 Tax=Anaerococcus sp. TaxID=1872515 RepID=UPI0027BAFBE2|nr:MerR family transcriptional regulator [Anaerococcus sp.]
MQDHYTIGKVSKMSNIPKETLRYYDKIGLFCPDYRDNETGYRYYSKESLKTLLILRRLRNLGFSIEALKNSLDVNSLDNLESLIYEKSLEYEKQIQILQARKVACDIAIKRFARAKKATDYIIKEGIDPIDFPVKIDYIEENPVVFSRKIMKNYVHPDITLARWIDIYEKCTENGLEMMGSILIIFHGRPFDQFLEKNSDVEFAMQVTKIEAGRLNKRVTRFWGGFEAVTSYYVGDYKNIRQKHKKMLTRINDHGYKVTGPITEEFLISPLDVDDPSKHVTKIIIPIEKR